MGTKYFAMEPVGDETAEQVELPKQQQAPESIRDIILTGLIFIACVAVSGLGGWYGHWLMSPPSFPEAQEELISKGYIEAAAILGEMGKTCPNGMGTRIACRLLITNTVEIARKNGGPEVSNALPDTQF